MRKSATNRPIFFVLALALIPALLLAAGPTSARTAKTVAKKAPIESLGKVVLTTTKGRTLYSLSVEKHGKFICTGSCLNLWHPLVVPKGVTPKGPATLGTVMRPDGRTQVSFKGRPLYSFGGDSKKGDDNGEGFMDVGTWHAAAVSKIPAPEPQPQPKPPENPYGY